MKTFLFTCLLMAIFSTEAISANLIITPSALPNAQCPGIFQTYYVSASGGVPHCTYTWVVTGGVIDGTNHAVSVAVKWNDQTGNGTLKVTATSCNPSSDNGSTVTNTYTRLSVVGLAWGVYNMNRA